MSKHFKSHLVFFGFPLLSIMHLLLLIHLHLLLLSIRPLLLLSIRPLLLLLSIRPLLLLLSIRPLLLLLSGILLLLLVMAEQEKTTNDTKNKCESMLQKKSGTINETDCSWRRGLELHDVQNVRQQLLGFGEPLAFRDARDIHKPLLKILHLAPEFNITAQGN